MSAEAAEAERAFRYRAVGRDGRAVSDVVRAADERAALRRLADEGLTVTRVDEVAAGRGALASRALRLSERVLIMRQLALMLEAGVPLLEALETVAQGIESRTGPGAVRGGDRRAAATASRWAGRWPSTRRAFPSTSIPMADIGEASGRVPDVLRQAAEQMAYEHGLRRDFVNALTYPAFLAAAGLRAIGFIFIEVVPRFSAMIGEDTSRLPALSRAVLWPPAISPAQPAAVLLGIGAPGRR